MDKYVSNQYCPHEIKTFFKNHPTNTLLDLLTSADVAYSILVYESCNVYWSDLYRKESGQEGVELSQPKYHEKRGAKMTMFADGWTQEGHEYYREIHEQIRKLWNKKNDKEKSFAMQFQLYWLEYVKENGLICYEIANRKNEDDEKDEANKRRKTDWEIDPSDEGQLNDEAGCDLEESVGDRN